MTSIGEDEWLDMWQPFQEQLLPLAKPIRFVLHDEAPTLMP